MSIPTAAFFSPAPGIPGMPKKPLFPFPASATSCAANKVFTIHRKGRIRDTKMEP